VIDLGSNSIKIANFVINPDNTYKAYHQEGIRVKLGDGLSQTGFLGEEAIERALRALKLFKDVIETQGIKHILPVATSAVRESANRTAFLNLVKKETALRFRILSEKEEALFSYVGAIRALRLPSVLFFDIGGGSLEIVHAHNFKIKKIMSLPLGALRLTQMYSEDGIFKQKEYEKMRERVLDLIPTRNELGLTEDTVLVGVGGTLRAIAKYHQSIVDYPLNKVHNYTISQADIQEIDSTFRSLTPQKIVKLGPINSGRAETIIAGSCVINLLMKNLKFNMITVSAQGLREGTLSLSLAFPKEFSSGNMFDVELVKESIRYACEPDILPQTIEDMVRLMISINQMSERERVILAQTFRQATKVSSFRNLDNLLPIIMDEDSSLTHREQLITVVSLIHSIKKKKAQKIFSEYDDMLHANDSKLIKKISIFVLLADILEKTGTKLKLRHKDNRLKIKLYPSKNNFPNVLFEEICKKIDEIFGIHVEYSILYDAVEYLERKPIRA
jgi:exopolyphosphatase/guanosine-5'-triphosphate,3'-diphosphate pyrophosphatase